MLRKLTDHKVNGLNEALEITADGPGPSGASHNYTLFIPDSVPTKPGVTVHTTLSFQNGPIATPEDFNGITNEALLAVVIDRMRGFQYRRFIERGADEPQNPPGAKIGDFDFNSRGQYACRENAEALTHLETGLMWLQKRTVDRMRRGVEGKHAA